MDEINGLFELFGSLFIVPSIVKIHGDKQVHGISWIHAGFFWCWGIWNLAYYPSLDQWASFFGGALLATANTVWLAQLVYYSRQTK